MNTYTICIPCVDKHIEIMEKILTSLKHFTVKPDKVIASISPRYLNLDLHSEKKRLEEKFPFLLCLVQDNITGVGENINYTSCIFNNKERIQTLRRLRWRSNSS